MGNYGLTSRHTDGRQDAVDPVVGETIRRLIENDARFDPATDADEIILDIEVDGVRYLAVRCRRRTSPQRKPEVDPDGSRPRPRPPLSPREFEIARMVAKGYANKTIASVLDISSWTVSSHLRRIFTKFGVTSRAAMVARLLDDGRSVESRPAATSSHRTLPTSSATAGHL